MIVKTKGFFKFINIPFYVLGFIAIRQKRKIVEGIKSKFKK